MKVTLCFGGSLLVPEQPDASVVREVVRVVSLLKKRRIQIFIVTGGGRQARAYIQQARKLNLSKVELDRIGIEVTRLNALMVIAALGKIAEPEPQKSVEASIEASFRGKIPVMGGTDPGHTTDAVAAMLARASGSDLLIIFSDVGGIYTHDPKVDPRAKKIREMTSKELVKLFGKKKREPGMTVVMDPVAAQLIDRYKIKTLVLGKSDLSRLPEILAGGKHEGTTINPVG
jgi:uridylate kinase